jgi:hypothetical protein
VPHHRLRTVAARDDGYAEDRSATALGGCYPVVRDVVADRADEDGLGGRHPWRHQLCRFGKALEIGAAARECS